MGFNSTFKGLIFQNPHTSPGLCTVCRVLHFTQKRLIICLDHIFSYLSFCVSLWNILLGLYQYKNSFMQYKILGVQSGVFEVSDMLVYNTSFYVCCSTVRKSMIISSPKCKLSVNNEHLNSLRDQLVVSKRRVPITKWRCATPQE